MLQRYVLRDDRNIGPLCSTSDSLPPDLIFEVQLHAINGVGN